jgi:hypothetical protein
MSETIAQQQPSLNENFKMDNLNLNDQNNSDVQSNVALSSIEQVYDLIRRNEDLEKLEQLLKNENVNVNEILKNGDTLLCLACNKGLENVVKILVEQYNADVNLSRGSNAASSAAYSSITPTITISVRRQSRLLAGSGGLNNKLAQRGDSPLNVCIKYGFENIAEYLIDKGADICGSDSTSTNNNQMIATQSTQVYQDFERSPLQEAIRLNRTKTVEKMLSNMFEKDDLRTVEWVFAKRYDILRQCLMTENLDTLKVILPNIIENRRIDGEMLIHILNYLLMKSKIQERKERVNQILETVMEVGTIDDNSKIQFEIYNLDIFVRGFLATLKALFNSVSSEDSRTSILTYRTSLFFFILKYQKSLVNFEQFYPDIDSTFDFFYSKMKETGENVLKLVEYFIMFYDTLITMNHIHLTSSNVINLLRLEHIKKLDILGEFLIQRSLIPLDLKEITRTKIKDTMHTYNLYTITNLPVLDQNCKDFLYFA